MYIDKEFRTLTPGQQGAINVSPRLANGYQ